MSIPNVDIDDSDRDRIKRFTSNTDMKKYVHDFLEKRMSAAVPPKQRIIHPEPVVELPKMVIQRPSPPSGQILSITIVRASSFVEIMDADPSTRILLDFNIAGRRWRSTEVEADADPKFFEKFDLELSESLDELVHFGSGSIVAILIAGPNRCVYGSGSFEWRRALAGYTGQPVSLYDPRTGDPCGVVHVKMQMSPQLCSQAELENLLRQETPNASHICKLSSRLIPTPFHALRFSGLFSVNKSRYATTGNVIKDEIQEEEKEEDFAFTKGFSIHSLLASCEGSKPDICALLCSIFCGFGYESFVCGSKVLTVHEKYSTLWDPFKCEKINVETLPTVVMYGYKCRLEPLIENPPAITDDPRIWKRYQMPDPLSHPSLLRCDQIDEESIENEVKKMICAVRHTKSTTFNKEIEVAMRPLLQTYESSKLNESCDIWAPPVNDAVRHLIPSKSTIKLAPFCVHSAEAKGIFMALQKKASNIMLSPQTDQFTLSLAIFPYAENLYVTWILFGAIFPI